MKNRCEDTYNLYLHKVFCNYFVVIILREFEIKKNE